MKLSALTRKQTAGYSQPQGSPGRVPQVTVNDQGLITNIAEVELRPEQPLSYFQLVNAEYSALKQRVVVSYEGDFPAELLPLAANCYFIFSGQKQVVTVATKQGRQLIISTEGLNTNFDFDSYCVVGQQTILLPALSAEREQSAETATTDGLVITTEFRSRLQGTETPVDWTVSAKLLSVTRAVAVSAVSISEKLLKCTLESTVAQGEIVSLSYQGQSITGLQRFQDLAVLNQSKFVEAAAVTPPELIGRQSSDSEITLIFDQTIRRDPSLQLALLIVENDTVQEGVSVIRVVEQENRIVLTLNRSIRYKDVTLEYLDGLQSSLSGTQVGSFSINFRALPRVTGVSGKGSEILVDFDRTLEISNLIRPEAFSLSVNQGQGRVESAEVTDRRIRLRLAGLGCFGVGLSCSDIALLSYSPPKFGRVRRAGVDPLFLEQFNGRRVELSGDPGPRVQSGQIMGREVQLEFSRDMSQVRPNLQSLTVTVGETTHGIARVDIVGPTVTLTLDYSATPEEIASLSYSAPATCCQARFISLDGIGVSSFQLPLRNITPRPDTPPIEIGQSCQGTTHVVTYSDGSQVKTEESPLCKCSVILEECGLGGENPRTNVLLWSNGRIDRFPQSAQCGYVAPDPVELLPPLEATIIQEGCGLRRQSSTTYVVLWSNGLQDNQILSERCLPEAQEL